MGSETLCRLFHGWVWLLFQDGAHAMDWRCDPCSTGRWRWAYLRRMGYGGAFCFYFRRCFSHFLFHFSQIARKCKPFTSMCHSNQTSFPWRSLMSSMFIAKWQMVSDDPLPSTAALDCWDSECIFCAIYMYSWYQWNRKPRVRNYQSWNSWIYQNWKIGHCTVISKLGTEIGWMWWHGHTLIHWE